MAPTSCEFTTSAPHLDMVTLAPGCPLPAQERAAQPQGVKEPKGGAALGRGWGGLLRVTFVLRAWETSGWGGDPGEGHWNCGCITPTMDLGSPARFPQTQDPSLATRLPHPCTRHTLCVPTPVSISVSRFHSSRTDRDQQSWCLCLRALLSNGNTVRATRVTGKSLRVVLQRSKESEITDNSFHVTSTSYIPNILSTGDR